MLDAIREDVTRILCTAEIQFTQPQQMELPELPDFMTNLGELDEGVSPAPAGSPFSADAFLGAGFGAGASAGSLAPAAGAVGEIPMPRWGLTATRRVLRLWPEVQALPRRRGLRPAPPGRESGTMQISCKRPAHFASGRFRFGATLW
jgi:hypothetical protein